MVPFVDDSLRDEILLVRDKHFLVNKTSCSDHGGRKIKRNIDDYQICPPSPEPEPKPVYEKYRAPAPEPYSHSGSIFSDYEEVEGEEFSGLVNLGKRLNDFADEKVADDVDVSMDTSTNDEDDSNMQAVNSDNADQI